MKLLVVDDKQAVNADGTTYTSEMLAVTPTSERERFWRPTGGQYTPEELAALEIDSGELSALERTSPDPLFEVMTIRPAPGDRIVFSLTRPASEANMVEIRDHAQSIFPDNPVLLLDYGVTLEAYVAAEAAP